jgi:hypothetical protein
MFIQRDSSRRDQILSWFGLIKQDDQPVHETIDVVLFQSDGFALNLNNGRAGGKVWFS